MADNKKSIGSRIGYWLTEIVIVFIGVYLAFFLDGYRTQLQNEQKQQQIYEALHRNFSDYANIKKNNSQTDSLLIRPFLSAYNNGEMPRLKKWSFLTLGINEKGWNAMLQSGGINLLDTELIRQVSYFYSNLELLRQETDRFNKMNDQYLIPNFDAEISHFYNKKTKKLRPQYEWYIHFVKVYRSYINQLASQAENILEVLEQRLGANQLSKIKADSTPGSSHTVAYIGQ